LGHQPVRFGCDVRVCESSRSVTGRKVARGLIPCAVDQLDDDPSGAAIKRVSSGKRCILNDADALGELADLLTLQRHSKVGRWIDMSIDDSRCNDKGNRKSTCVHRLRTLVAKLRRRGVGADLDARNLWFKLTLGYPWGNLLQELINGVDCSMGVRDGWVDLEISVGDLCFRPRLMKGKLVAGQMREPVAFERAGSGGGSKRPSRGKLNSELASRCEIEVSGAESIEDGPCIET